MKKLDFVLTFFQFEVYFKMTMIKTLFILLKLAAGTKLSTVYNSVKEFLSKSKYPSLGDKLTKSIGFAMGIDFRESSLLISPKGRVII